MRPKKVLDTGRLARSLPDLARLRAVGRDGPLAGVPVQLSWTGEFTAALPRRVRLTEFSRDDILLDSPLGEITLERPLVTRAAFDGVIRGLAISTHLRRIPVATPTVMRTFIRTDADLGSRVCFPGTLTCSATGSVAWALLPLTVGGTPLDVYFLCGGPFLVIELRPAAEGSPTWDPFTEVSGAAQRLLTYLLGERFDADFCEVAVDGDRDQVVEARWYRGRDRVRHDYPPIAVSWPDWAAVGGRPTPDGVPRAALDPQALSRCLEYFLANRALVTTLEYLIAFPEALVEMRGAFLSVALESLTDHLAKSGLLAPRRLLPETAWTPLRERILALVEAESGSWTADQRSAFRNRLIDLNRPTNNQKLMQPFEALGIELTEPQRKAIKRRNKLLHQGRLLDPEVVAADPESWREAYAVEMHLYTAINLLLLKRMGYSGPVIDWGNTSLESGERAYLLR